MKASARVAAAPSLEMLRMKDSGMSNRACRAMSALMPSGLAPLETAAKKLNQLSATNTRPVHTKPSCESVMLVRITLRIQGPAMVSPISP